MDRQTARIVVIGDVSLAEARGLAREWATLNVGPSVELDLDELELSSGPACAAMVDAVRAFTERGVQVTLRSAPQALAHVIYRVGMTQVRFDEVRSDEPTVN